MSRRLPGPGALVLFGLDKAGFAVVGFDAAGWGVGFEGKGGDGLFFTTGRTGREGATGSREGRKGMAGLALAGFSELTLRLSKVREVLTENGACAGVSLFFPSFSGVTLGTMAGFATLAARGFGLSGAAFGGDFLAKTRVGRGGESGMSYISSSSAFLSEYVRVSFRRFDLTSSTSSPSSKDMRSGIGWLWTSGAGFERAVRAGRAVRAILLVEADVGMRGRAGSGSGELTRVVDEVLGAESSVAEPPFRTVFLLAAAFPYVVTRFLGGKS